MIDIVIPLAHSWDGHEDLRYTLRGIEKNVKNFRKIWIVGDLPNWIQNVNHIPFSDADHPKFKEKNIKDKISGACMNPGVSEDFIMFNDDHFIISEIDAEKYPFYNKGSVRNSVLNNYSPYKKTMKHTLDWLLRRGFRDLNADTHCPIIYNKKKFLNSFNNVDFLTPWGYGIKTLYCAVNRIETEYMPDCKFKAKASYEEVVEKSQGRHVISCYDGAINGGFGKFVKELFPNKSCFEK